ncbi:hypothetical protein MLD38_020060 [Melastoma candidum]|uniref:Uncharacterized protein n=1 Tax=Melastoma candidum TaxID=119954 RepID=A0ACB9QDM3_9MYRT|nr:hypothetical protein MLD38_020060 [Melastoma candidum]
MEATTPSGYQAIISSLGSDGIISLISSSHLKSPSSFRGSVSSPLTWSSSSSSSNSLRISLISAVSTSVISMSSTSKSNRLHESDEAIEGREGGLRKTRIRCRTANEKG